MYSNPFFVRQLSPLLTDSSDPTDSNIRLYIRRAESKINLWVGGRYTTPITPTTYLTGTITVNKGSAVIVGSSTTFLTDLQLDDVIQVASTNEVLRIADIESNTRLTVTSNAISTSSGASYWIMPDAFVTASSFLAACYLINQKFAETSGNQDEVEKYIKRFCEPAEDIINELKTGNYLNTGLTEQVSSAGSERLISYDVSSDLRDLIETNDELFISSSFK